MRKQMVAGIAFYFGIFSIGGSACSSSSSGVAPIDAGKDSSLSIQPDAGSCIGNGDIFDPSSVLSFTTAPLASKANQGKCASDDLVSQFLAACNPFPDVDAGPDAGNGCDAFISANADCARCLGGYSAPDASAPLNSPWPALLQIDEQGHAIPSVAACAAAISTGDDTCKSNYANDDLCAESGCGPWFGTPDYAACYQEQTTSPCSTCLYDNPIDAACQAAIAAVSPADADAKCGASTQIQSDADFELVFLKVGRTLCE
jgi:hypothetical protein